jgi:inhibitor of KinA sporulation pathway (predicted exonuclease)
MENSDIVFEDDEEVSSDFDFLIVLDFEATCDENNKKWQNEIIEFPMVLVDLKDLEIKKSFREYVRPTINPMLTDFCTTLTGITQETVDAADTFENVFLRANEWIDNVMQEYNITSIDKFAFVTCGDWDLGRMLPNQCKLMKRHYNQTISIPSYFKRWINIKVPCKQYFKSRDGRVMRQPEYYGMVGMLEALGLPLQGRHHSGLDDSTNTAYIAIELIKRGQRFRYTCVDE